MIWALGLCACRGGKAYTVAGRPLSALRKRPAGRKIQLEDNQCDLNIIVIRISLEMGSYQPRSNMSAVYMQDIMKLCFITSIRPLFPVNKAINYVHWKQLCFAGKCRYQREWKHVSPPWFSVLWAEISIVTETCLFFNPSHSKSIVPRYSQQRLFRRGEEL